MMWLSNLMDNSIGMDSFFKPFSFLPVPPAVQSMKADIVENEKDYALTVDTPGFTKEDLNVSLRDGYLVVKAEKNNEKEEKKENYIRRERVYGSTSRSFYVGDEVKEEDITAKFENGALHITIPKIEKKEEEKKSIEIQ